MVVSTSGILNDVISLPSQENLIPYYRKLTLVLINVLEINATSINAN